MSVGGVYGHHWFLDPVAGFSVVSLTNTALEGCTGAFPADLEAAIYAARRAATSPVVPDVDLAARGD